MKNMAPALKMARKFLPKWNGPYRVMKFRSSVSVDVEHMDTGKNCVAHITILVRAGLFPPEYDTNSPDQQEEATTDASPHNGPQVQHRYNLRP
jgi:hypothetical protein